MAISGSGNNGYGRTTTLPSITSWSMCAWIYVTTDTYGGMLSFGNHAGSSFYGLEYDDVANVLNIANPAANFPGSTLSLNTWYHVGWSCAGTGAGQLLGYLNGALDITADGNSGPTAVSMRWMDYTFSAALTGRMAAFKVWGAVLTAAEFALEMRQYVPVRRTNLNSFYPLLSTATDQDDFGPGQLAATVQGSLSNAEGPPIPFKRGQRRVLPLAAPPPPVCRGRKGWFDPHLVRKAWF